MEKPDFIKHCRYYKGEEKCPFDRSSNPGFFWCCEQMYVENVRQHKGFNLPWEDSARQYISTHPNENNDLTSDKFSIETKGLILYIEAMLEKWRPYDVNIIFDY